LLSLDGFEQRFEISGTETFGSHPLDDFKE
jgi:hypothetical protein